MLTRTLGQSPTWGRQAL